MDMNGLLNPNIVISTVERLKQDRHRTLIGQDPRFDHLKNHALTILEKSLALWFALDMCQGDDDIKYAGDGGQIFTFKHPTKYQVEVHPWKDHQPIMVGWCEHFSDYSAGVFAPLSHSVNHGIFRGDFLLQIIQHGGTEQIVIPYIDTIAGTLLDCINERPHKT